MNLKRISVVFIALLALVVVAGVAGAFASSSSQPTGAGAQRSHLGSARDLSVFDGSFVPTQEQRSVLNKLQAWARTAPAESILATADLGGARPASIPGSAQSVWLAPAANGGLCAFTPQPGTGGERFGAACSSLDDLNATGLISATYGDASQGTVVVTVVEPDGVDAPVILDANGNVRQVALRSNVAVTTAQYGDAVEVSGLRLDVRAPRELSLP